MPKPGHRSRSLRRIHVTSPGGNKSIQYKTKRPSAAVCGSCGSSLKGTPRAKPFEMRNLSKTKKRPERPFGGVLCSRCMRNKIVEESR